MEALCGVDLLVAPGEYVAIMGPSGSGKSTLLHLLSALEHPTSGQVFLDGCDLAAMNDDQRTILRRRRIGLIFQSFNLLPTLTAGKIRQYPSCWPARSERSPGNVPGSPGVGRPFAPAASRSQYIIGRRAAARGDRPRAGDLAKHPAGR